MPMSPRLLRPIAGKTGGFDANAQAYITAVELADTQPLELAVKVAINDFVIGCKSDGIWSALKACCILIGARTLSGALTPLVGAAPTNNNFVSGDYNRKTGLIGNGSTKYLNTNRANNADPQNDFHMSSYHSTSGRMTMGEGGFAVNGSSLFFSDGGTQCRSASNINVGAGAGFTGASRSSSAEYLVRRITTNTTASLTSSLPSSNNLFVLARNFNNSPDSYSSQRCAFYSIGTSLSLSSLGTRVNDLYAAIGAAIP